VETGTVLDGKHISYRKYLVGKGQYMADVSRKFHVVRISTFNDFPQATDLQSQTLRIQASNIRSVERAQQSSPLKYLQVLSLLHTINSK
jgi:hypothetical protein